jgi:hypothetical protein
VYTFDGRLCGVPIVVDHYWIEAVPAIGGVVVLDVSDPARPVKVSQLSLGADQFTHWLAWDEAGSRISLIPGARTAGCSCSDSPANPAPSRGTTISVTRAPPGPALA